MTTPTLNFAQVRILKLLTKLGRAQTRTEISVKTNTSGLVNSLGPLHAEDLSRSPDSLLGRKYVICALDSLDGPPSYAVTAAGKKALKDLNDDVTWPFGH